MNWFNRAVKLALLIPAVEYMVPRANRECSNANTDEDDLA